MGMQQLTQRLQALQQHQQQPQPEQPRKDKSIVMVSFESSEPSNSVPSGPAKLSELLDVESMPTSGPDIDSSSPTIAAYPRQLTTLSVHERRKWCYKYTIKPASL